MTPQKNPVKPLVNEKRLWDDLMAIAKLTQADLPYTRRSFSQEFIAGREFLKQKMTEAGLSVRIDEGGNLIGSLKGTDPNAGVIMIGSHSDTVPGGGRFDGVAGVIAAIEIARTLKERDQPLRHTVEAVDFLAEEPSEFGLSCIGSRAMVRALEPGMLDYQTPNGERLSQAIDRIGGHSAQLSQGVRSDIKAFFELHIEQGPVLETKQIDIGIVTGIVKIRRVEIIFKGDANHAGTTPMGMRQDAAVAAAETILLLRIIADQFAAKKNGHFVATAGLVEIEPNAANVIPLSARLLLDIRSESEEQMELFYEELDHETQAIAEKWKVTRNIFRIVSDSKPASCNLELRQLLTNCANGLNLSNIEMASGAGHDTAFLARVAPSAMVFIPCKAGKSHASEEWAEPEALAAGANVLAEAILRLDQAR